MGCPATTTVLCEHNVKQKHKCREQGGSRSWSPPYFEQYTYNRKFSSFKLQLDRYSPKGFLLRLQYTSHSSTRKVHSDDVDTT